MLFKIHETFFYKQQRDTREMNGNDNVARTGFFGRLTGLDIEAELQRHALLLKGPRCLVVHELRMNFSQRC